jgi:NSS family neurotransmitter:Na+ symporter
MSRVKGCFIFGFIGWAIGMLSVFSFNIWSNVRPLGMFEVFGGMTVFGLIDYFTANLLMPLGGILIAVFVGWRIRKEHLESELVFPSPMVAQAWLFLIRFAAPVAILLVLISSLR